MDRRGFVSSAGALAAIAGIGAAQAQDDISARARALYRRATVLDCNLGPPIYSEDLPVPQQDRDLARNAGVTIIKTSMGGFNAPFEDTLTEMALYMRVIEAHPDTFTQIRSVADIAAAKRDRKLGIIFSFESATCLED